VHTVTLVAATVDEYFADGQLVHAKEPFVILYVPATQAVQGLPFGPV
jgi:hypothetical protein